MSVELLDRREEKFLIMFHSEAHYENHDSKVTVNHLKCLPIISGRLSLCAAQIISVERGGAE